MKTKIKKYRVKENLSQKALGQAIGVSGTAIYKYENDICEPTMSVLIKLSDYFHTTVDNLISHEVPYLIDTSLLTDTQIELIDKIKNINDVACGKLISYLDGLKSK